MYECTRRTPYFRTLVPSYAFGLHHSAIRIGMVPSYPRTLVRFCLGEPAFQRPSILAFERCVIPNSASRIQQSLPACQPARLPIAPWTLDLAPLFDSSARTSRLHSAFRIPHSERPLVHLCRLRIWPGSPRHFSRLVCPCQPTGAGKCMVEIPPLFVRLGLAQISGVCYGFSCVGVRP